MTPSQLETLISDLQDQIDDLLYDPETPDRAKLLAVLIEAREELIEQYWQSQTDTKL